MKSLVDRSQRKSNAMPSARGWIGVTWVIASMLSITQAQSAIRISTPASLAVLTTGKLVQSNIIRAPTSASEHSLVRASCAVDAKSYVWFVLSAGNFVEYVATEPSSKAIAFTGPPGRYQVMCVVVDGETNRSGFANIDIIANKPTPPEPSPPEPKPPTPPEPTPPAPNNLIPDEVKLRLKSAFADEASVNKSDELSLLAKLYRRGAEVIQSEPIDTLGKFWARLDTIAGELNIKGRGVLPKVQTVIRDLLVSKLSTDPNRLLTSDQRTTTSTLFKQLADVLEQSDHRS